MMGFNCERLFSSSWRIASSKRCASSGLISSACGMDGELSEAFFHLTGRVFQEMARMDRWYPIVVGKNQILAIDLADFVMDLRSLAVAPVAPVACCSCCSISFLSRISLGSFG